MPCAHSRRGAFYLSSNFLQLPSLTSRQYLNDSLDSYFCPKELTPVGTSSPVITLLSLGSGDAPQKKLYQTLGAISFCMIWRRCLQSVQIVILHPLMVYILCVTLFPQIIERGIFPCVRFYFRRGRNKFQQINARQSFDFLFRLVLLLQKIPQAVDLAPA